MGRSIWGRVALVGLVVTLSVGACSDAPEPDPEGEAGAGGAPPEAGGASPTSGRSGSSAGGGSSAGRGGSSAGRGGRDGGAGAGGAESGDTGGVGGSLHAGGGGQGGAGSGAIAGAGGGESGGAAGEAGQGGEGGGSPGCLSVPPVVLGPQQCRTFGQCEGDESCLGTQTANVCVPLGEGCDSPEHCPEGETCSEHRCVAAAPVGSPCSAGDRCAAGAQCGYAYVLDHGDWVASGSLMCRERIAELGACDIVGKHDPRGGCQAGLVCSFNRSYDYGEPVEYCFPQSDESRPYDACPTGDRDCLPGYQCSSNNEGESFCDPALEEGDLCEPKSASTRCAEDLGCVFVPEDEDTFCRPLPGACEPCGDAKANRKGLRCDPSSFCDAGICRPKPVFGRGCDGQLCAPGLVCVAAQLDGSCSG